MYRLPECLALFDYKPCPMARYGVELEMGNVMNKKCLASAMALVVGAPAAAAPAAILTMSEWAMIMSGGFLAGGAALYFQRRRMIWCLNNALRRFEARPRSSLDCPA